MNYEFHPEAEREFIEEAAYYESEAPGLGSRFAGEVSRVVSLTFFGRIRRLARPWTRTCVILC